MVFLKPIDTDFLSRLTFITLLIFGLNVPSHAIGAKEKGKERAEYYQTSSLEEYESFDDYYLVMKSLGFPNLISVESDSEVSKIDFKNPKSISIYKSLLRKRNEDYRSLNAKQTPPKEIFRKKTKEESRKLRADGDRRLNAIYAFQKKGYYEYYKEKMKETSSRKQKICININRVKLGLFTTVDRYVSTSEVREVTNNTILYSLGSLGYDDYSNLEMLQGISDCHATVELSNTGLDILNQDPNIGSFSNPENAHIVTFNLHKNSQ